MTILSSQPWRAVRVLLTTTLAAVALGAPVAGASTFMDTAGNVHGGSIDYLAARGITAGCNPQGTLYCPSDAVTRGQMATFIVRSLQQAGVSLPASPPDAFADDNGRPHERSNNLLAAIGVVAGGADGRYQPNADVNRGQMALFLQRAFDLPAPGGNRFVDVAGVYVNAANAIASAGITLGCDGTGTRYCPTDAVRRDQMASFLRRALELPDQSDDAQPTPDPSDDALPDPGGEPDLPAAPSDGPPGAGLPPEPPPDTEAAATDVAAAGRGTLSATCGYIGTGFGDTMKINDYDLIPAWGWTYQWIATRGWVYTVPIGGTVADGSWWIGRDWNVFLVDNYSHLTAIGGDFRIGRGWHAAYLEAWSWDGYNWHLTTTTWVPFLHGGWWCMGY
jgi:hypothetical protein